MTSEPASLAPSTDPTTAAGRARAAPGAPDAVAVDPAAAEAVTDPAAAPDPAAAEAVTDPAAVPDPAAAETDETHHRPESDIRIGGVPIEIAPHNCFACGTLNAHGLQLALHTDGERCWTELALDRRFEGWEGIAHGGIICTLLDEVMAWALIDHDTWGVTARMAVEFRRPVEVGVPIRAEGRVIEARRRVFRTEGVILDPESGLELARADGTYVAAPEERKRELKERYGFRPAAGSPTTGASRAEPPLPESTGQRTPVSVDSPSDPRPGAGAIP